MSLNTLEQKMIDFIKEIEHSRTRHISANTKIVAEAYDYDSEGKLIVEVQVYLHSNLIACWHPRTCILELNTCGWETKTTKNRMNALLEGLGFKERVKKIKGSWYVTDYRNELSRNILFTKPINLVRSY